MKRTAIRMCAALLLMTICLTGCAKDSSGDGKTTGSPTPAGTEVSATPSQPPKPIKDAQGGTVITRFNPPAGYARVGSPAGSFGDYLQTLPLKEDGAPVLLFDGKQRQDAHHEAVIDLDIGKTDVQQGTDALIRLRAEYLFKTGKFDAISYHFMSGFECPFSKWAEGYRVKVSGKNVAWELKAEPSADYATFQKYLNTLFVYVNARSLPADLEIAGDMQIGDVFVNNESGGVMVIDMAESPGTGDTVFLLAQAKIPAQSIHILQNTANPALSPWYSYGELPLTTPEGTYGANELFRFREGAGAAEEGTQEQTTAPADETPAV